MKKIILLAIIILSVKGLSAQETSSQKLPARAVIYYVDDVQASQSVVEKLSPSEIASMKVLNGNAIPKHLAKDKDAVIYIETKNYLLNKSHNTAVKKDTAVAPLPAIKK